VRENGRENRIRESSCVHLRVQNVYVDAHMTQAERSVLRRRELMCAMSISCVHLRVQNVYVDAHMTQAERSVCEILHLGRGSRVRESSS